MLLKKGDLIGLAAARMREELRALTRGLTWCSYASRGAFSAWEVN